MDLSVYEAVKTGDYTKVLESLHSGHDIDATHLLSERDLRVLRVWPKQIPYSFTALQWLAMFHCHNYNPRILQILLESGANTEIRNSKGETPLMILATCQERCCSVQRMHMMSQLLDHGADVDALTVEDESPLFASMYSNSIPQVQLLIHRGADVNRTHRTLSMLQWTIVMEVHDIAILLIKYGADPGLSCGRTGPIEMARKKGETNLADEMEQTRANFKFNRLDVLAQCYDFSNRPKNNRSRTDDNRQDKNNVGDLGRDPWAMIMRYVHQGF
jgi:ankyrin repeat protein